MNPKNHKRRFQSISRAGILIVFCNEKETFSQWTKILTKSSIPFRAYGLTIEIRSPR